jgi:hypothetical protein
MLDIGQRHAAAIQAINSDGSLTFEEKTVRVAQLQNERNEAALRATTQRLRAARQAEARLSAASDARSKSSGCAHVRTGASNPRVDVGRRTRRVARVNGGDDVPPKSGNRDGTRFDETVLAGEVEAGGAGNVGEIADDAAGPDPAAPPCAECAEEAADAKRRRIAAHGGKFPGAGAECCTHYDRKCWLKPKCCTREDEPSASKYYPCRRCHDENEDHAIDRHATEFVACTVCGAEDQPVGAHCGHCGVRFASYYCGVCRFYDDDSTKDIYHCVKCGICRVGREEENYHCDKCNSCVPRDVADTHPCMERSLESACPVCRVYMATSTEQVVFMRCGHAMHAKCFEQYTEQSYTCPLCSKSLTNMERWYRALDVRIASEIMPPPYSTKRTNVLCHDCDERSTVKFHFRFHKCGRCAGYNTRILSYAPAADGCERGLDSGGDGDGGTGADVVDEAARYAALYERAAASGRQCRLAHVAPTIEQPSAAGSSAPLPAVVDEGLCAPNGGPLGQTAGDGKYSVEDAGARDQDALTALPPSAGVARSARAKQPDPLTVLTHDSTPGGPAGTGVSLDAVAGDCIDGGRKREAGRVKTEDAAQRTLGASVTENFAASARLESGGAAVATLLESHFPAAGAPPGKAGNVPGD